MQARTKFSTVLLCALLLGLLFASVPQAKAADATAASIELSADSFMEGTPVTIRVYDVVSAGGEFIVYFTYDSSGTDTIEAKSAYANISVDLGASDDDWTRTMLFPAPTAGAYIRVHVTTSGAPDTDLDSAQIDATDVEDLIPTDFIITLGVALMIIGIIVAIVVSLYRRRA